MTLTVGIDIGSTTVKVVVCEKDIIIFQAYERHFSKVRQKTAEILKSGEGILKNNPFKIALSGSAALGFSKANHLPFIQEVFATSQVMGKLIPSADVVVELGGEDAKLIFMTGGLEERMNGTCAGGTGAFIDQMASLMDLSLEELDALSLKAEKIYTIASRCGVFAKSDIQPLLNQGAKKEDIAASIFQAVVDQTITGLAQGRQIAGNVVFLGGPLFFLKGLRKRFVETLELTASQAIFPKIALYAVAVGAALFAETTENIFTLFDVLEILKKESFESASPAARPPLFENETEYETFKKRHQQSMVPETDISAYEGKAYLGIDCGSTTTKLVLLAENKNILYTFYAPNKGNPVEILKEQLEIIFEKCADRITIASSAVTGYGEDLIKNAFSLDFGLVETMAHYRAASYFSPDVSFIIDIGGQDIKCFKIRNRAIDNIMLNEACSSGCGSFVESFASSMGYSVADFSKAGLFAKRPIDLGSRCTVFMNSAVKQAQKDGATFQDISAGLSISVVKNALYKVIRVKNASELGEHIVVQGGTFLNDAILRSFELELKKEVVRPSISGLMGAFGAALYAIENQKESSIILSPGELSSFTHTSKSTNCKMCTNNCTLTINAFSGNRKFISGNRCERPLGIKPNPSMNIYEYKLNYLKNLDSRKGPLGKIGLPFGLNMYELLPFWHKFFTSLGFEVVVSDISSRKLYHSGQTTIPSDTVCYPAKLIHGHIENLFSKGIETIFYPCMTYNINERKGDNFYNCPLVSYYPELLNANIKKLRNINFMFPYIKLQPKNEFIKKMTQYLIPLYPTLTYHNIKKASRLAQVALDSSKKKLLSEAAKAIALAEEKNLPLVVLAGRPYHADPEVNHGIDQLIASYNIVVVSEDCVCDIVKPQKVNVLNQWTYHARLYNAAKYVAQTPNAQLVQLVSFGCGIDAITTDEVRDILESSGKIYTQIKIDEIVNLGAAKIRIRSMLEAALQGGGTS